MSARTTPQEPLPVAMLSEEMARQMDELGYVVLGQLIDPAEAERMAARIDELIALEGAAAGMEIGMDEKTGLLGNLVAKDPIFDRCAFDPNVLGVVRHVLGDAIRLFAINARNPPRGAGHQDLHADWLEPVGPGNHKIVNSIWMLDPFTDNGPTRLVAGTHRSGDLPRDVMTDPAAAHPDEAYLTGPAGTVVVFNGHLWHGGTANTSGRPRHSITCAFAVASEPQQYDIAGQLGEDARARLGPAQLALLGFPEA